MKVTDYVIEYFISKGVSDIFGYPGGVICHLMDSATKYPQSIQAHATYHEQAAAFAACGYAQESLHAGVAYATSGPGATNLITGIANAYFDSIPVVFITGQVDTFALKKDSGLRQKGFQETDITEMVKPITKYSMTIESASSVRLCIEQAYFEATNGRPGPVLIDIPADIQRMDISPDNWEGFAFPIDDTSEYKREQDLLLTLLAKSLRPCLLVGSGIKQTGLKGSVRELAEKLSVPVVTTLPAFDVLPQKHPLNYGFIGTNGHRYANFVVQKCDLLISVGSRLDLKQVGNNRSRFAPNAQLVRLDIDENESDYSIRDNDIKISCDLKEFIPAFMQRIKGDDQGNKDWLGICDELKEKLKMFDMDEYHGYIAAISDMVPENTNITIDVGHHLLWVAQSFRIKEKQNVYISSGLGSMGYALPAAIGVFYATRKPVICFCGDGGIQMNIQELQMIKRDELPIKIILINNCSLGMIRHFQEMNFSENYFQTTQGSGYSVPDFEKIATAYGIKYIRYESGKTINFTEPGPEFIEISGSGRTYLYPKFSAKGSLADQEPFIDRELYKYLDKL